ncbi:hypothetical protein MTO96_014267 [Rhipicephalus appendiculatus]
MLGCFEDDKDEDSTVAADAELVQRSLAVQPNRRQLVPQQPRSAASNVRELDGPPDGGQAPTAPQQGNVGCGACDPRQSRLHVWNSDATDSGWGPDNLGLRCLRQALLSTLATGSLPCSPRIHWPLQMGQ